MPAALLLCWILKLTGLGAFFLRTFFGMWLHELGHASAAWMCGYPAFPGPWITSIGEERSYFFALMMAAGLGALIWRGREQEDRSLVIAGIAGLVLLVVGTLGVSDRRAQIFITFGGDAGSLFFGAAAMAAFGVPREHKLHRDWLRWGLLVIGAASFVDTFQEWWTARTDPSVIPFGELEGIGPTDVTKLVDWYQWSVAGMTRAYLAVGFLSLAALIGLQIFHIRRAQAELSTLEKA